MRLEDDGGHAAHVPPQSECEVVIPPECPRVGKAVSAHIIKMDPAGRGFVNRLVDGSETVFGQAVGDPFVEVLFRLISHDPELADADRIEKNAHKLPLKRTKD